MLRIERIIDLSIPISFKTPIYPGDPQTQITPVASIDIDGFNVSALHFGSHTGTHVDAPYHFRKEGAPIDLMPLGSFIGEGVVINVTGKNPGAVIQLEDVEPYLECLGPGKVALIHTGWSKYISDSLYFNHPYVDEKAVDAMLNKGVRTFFIDALNIDSPDGQRFPAHDKITAIGGIIGENFAHFEEIDFDQPWIIALPLKIQHGDGSPVRAAALKFSYQQE